MNAKKVLTALALFVVAGCDFCANREMELFPGVTWEYFSMRHSRITFEHYGVITEGNLFVSFHQYGISVSGGENNFYLDARTNELVGREDMIGSSEGYAVMDASTSFGIFSKESHRDFKENMRLLQDRVNGLSDGRLQR